MQAGRRVGERRGDGGVLGGEVEPVRPARHQQAQHAAERPGPGRVEQLPVVSRSLDVNPGTGLVPGRRGRRQRGAQTTFASLPEVGTENAQGLGLVWTPDSVGLALTISRSKSEATPAAVTGIRFYDLTGRRLRTIPADTSLIDAAGFSPDGSQLALVDQHRPTTVTVADATTGAPRRVVDLSRPARLIGWADDDHLLVVVDGSSAPPGAERRDELLVVDLDGQIVRTIRPAAFAQHLFTGRSSGMPASVADLTF